MKNKKIIKERFFSGDKTKFYPFTPLKLNDNSLLDRSFTYKHEKKLNNLIQEIQISFDENKRLMPKKEQTNTRLKQLLKQRIFDLNKENPLISPTNKRNYLMKKTLRKTIISPVKGIQASCREEGSISKDLLKKFSYDNSLRSRESEFEHQPQKNTINDKKVKDNIIIKQRGLNLNDSVEKKCHSEIKSNKSKSLMNDNEDSLDDKQYKASNIFYLSLEAVEIIKKELKNPEEIRNFKKIDAYLKDLHYLKKFSIFFRKKIYRFCKFFEFKQNEAIFKEEDVSDNVYIILRGAISIQVK